MQCWLRIATTCRCRQASSQLFSILLIQFDAIRCLSCHHMTSHHITRHDWPALCCCPSHGPSPQVHTLHDQSDDMSSFAAVLKVLLSLKTRFCEQASRSSEQRGQHSLPAGSSQRLGPGSGPPSADWGLQSHSTPLPENHGRSTAASPPPDLSRLLPPL